MINKKWRTSFLLIPGLLLTTTSFAAKLNVPGDFPNSFHMDLLAGSLQVDFEHGNNPFGELTVYPTNGLSQILFDATAFDNPDGTGGMDVNGNILPGGTYGTSYLTLTSTQDWEIATVEAAAGATTTLYVDGNGTGTLVDNGDGTGDWTLQVPIYGIWNNTRFDFEEFTFSTNASYDYFAQGGLTETISGISMDYETGDAFLVGQAMVDDPGHAFNGLRITVGMHGNDPVLVTPVPAAVWLFGSGLLALIGCARRKQFSDK